MLLEQRRRRRLLGESGCDMRRGDDVCRRPAVGSEEVGSEESEEGERVEVLQRDDAHARQRDGEGLDVTLQVVDRQALAL